jgi:hypothetical protein
MTARHLLALGFLLVAATAPAQDQQSFSGMCDASAVVVLDQDQILVAQDERNTAAVYDFATGGAPTQELPLGPLLFVREPKDAAASKPEADLEGLARAGDLLFFVASNGRDSKGAIDLNRHRIGSGVLAKGPSGWTIAPQDGLAAFMHTNLRDVLGSVPDIATSIGTKEKDDTLAPEKGGLNIEGLAALPDGTLMIGLRSPTPNGQALVVRARAATWPCHVDDADLFRLDLGGSGVRSIDWDDDHKRYVIVAGPSGSSGDFALYTWGGAAEKPTKLSVALPAGFRAEGLALTANGTRAILVSDDGDVPVTGDCKDGKANPDGTCPCKHLEKAEKKSFQALRVALE